MELLLSLRLTDLDLMIGGFRLIVLDVEEDLGRMLLLMLLLLLFLLLLFCIFESDFPFLPVRRFLLSSKIFN